MAGTSASFAYRAVESKATARQLVRTLAALLLLLAVTWTGCDLFGETNPARSGGPVLVAAVDGNEPGLWLFDPRTLERVAVLDETMEGRAPKGVAFSPNYRRWYLTWSTGSYLSDDAQNVLAVFDPASGRLTRRTSTSDLDVAGAPMIYDPASDHIIAYGSGSGRVQHFDAETLELIHTQAIVDEGNAVTAAAVADEQGVIYLGADTQVFVYDASSQKVTSTLRPADDPVLRENGITDLALSPDERSLYATTYSLSTGGVFSAVDLESGETVFEHPAGSFANLAVHPEGRYVYIDCPAGGLRNLIPTQQVHRFDVEAREMEVFIDGARGMGMESGVLVASHITVRPDGETLVMGIAGGVKNAEGENIHLARVDTETGRTLATYSFPRDDRGYVTSRFVGLRHAMISK